MITKLDIELLKEVFVTREEFARFESKFDTFRDDIITRFDNFAECKLDIK